MLFDAVAIDEILRDLEKSLAGKTVVNTSSVPEEFSHYLAKEVSQVGGQFVEMPVSGSKLPAEQYAFLSLLLPFWRNLYVPPTASKNSPDLYHNRRVLTCNVP